MPDTAPEPPSPKVGEALKYYGDRITPGASSKGATGGGGRPSGPSDYDKANKAMRGTYDEDRAATQEGANAEKGRAAMMAQGAADIAQRKMEDQAIAQVEAANAAKHFEDYSAETQRQIDDVKSLKIEPNRAYSDAGSAFAAVIGGILGGVYQGMNKLSSNPFIDQMNKVIDRDIDIQKHDIATKKGAIAERKGMLADMRGTFKDEQLAKLQAKNLYYEGAKEQLAAEAATYDSPAIQARANQAIAAINREQTKLDINDAIRKASAAQAAAGAAEHRRQMDFENQLKLQDMRNKTVTADATASKDYAEGGKKESAEASRFVATGKDKDGNPTGYLESAPADASSAKEARTARAELRAELEEALRIRNEAGTLGRTLNRSNPNDAIQLYTPEWQTNIRQSQAKITALTNKASKLGTIDAGTIPLLNAIVGDLETKGDSADVRLRGMIGQLDRSEKATADTAAGQQVTKYIGADGKEHIAPHGASNAPTNQKVTPREKVQ